MSRNFRVSCRTLGVAVLLLGLSAQADAAFVMDGGFEAPALPTGSFQYNPAGSAWTFASSSGISNPHNAFDRSSASQPGLDAPEGEQYAFLQDNGKMSGAMGVFSQTISGFNIGDVLTVSFLAAGRPVLFNGATAGANPFQVLFNSAPVLAVSVAQLVPSSGFQSFSVSFATSNVTSGVLSFNGLGVEQFGAQDRTTFFDQIEVTASAPSPVPEPSPIVLVGLFVACLAVGSWYQRRQKVGMAA